MLKLLCNDLPPSRRLEELHKFICSYEHYGIHHNSAYHIVIDIHWCEEELDVLRNLHPFITLKLYNSLVHQPAYELTLPTYIHRIINLQRIYSTSIPNESFITRYCSDNITFKCKPFCLGIEWTPLTLNYDRNEESRIIDWQPDSNNMFDWIGYTISWTSPCRVKILWDLRTNHDCIIVLRSNQYGIQYIPSTRTPILHTYQYDIPGGSDWLGISIQKPLPRHNNAEEIAEEDIRCLIKAVLFEVETVRSNYQIERHIPVDNGRVPPLTKQIWAHNPSSSKHKQHRALPPHIASAIHMRRKASAPVQAVLPPTPTFGPQRPAISLSALQTLLINKQQMSDMKRGFGVSIRR